MTVERHGRNNTFLLFFYAEKVLNDSLMINYKLTINPCSLHGQYIPKTQFQVMDATSKVFDQPAHMHRIIKAFAVRACATGRPLRMRRQFKFQ